jgi:cell volume regulation protein A
MLIIANSPGDGHRIDQLPGLSEDAWISLVVRQNQLPPVTGRTTLHAGDQLLITADPGLVASFGAIQQVADGGPNTT